MVADYLHLIRLIRDLGAEVHTQARGLLTADLAEGEHVEARGAGVGPVAGSACGRESAKGPCVWGS